MVLNLKNKKILGRRGGREEGENTLFIVSRY